MIVRFDTAEEAKKRFESIKGKHEKQLKFFSSDRFAIEPGADTEFETVQVLYILRDDMIIVQVSGDFQYLITAMKIVDLMQEV